MRKFFLACVLFGLTAFGLTTCADSNMTNRNNAPSNANSAVLNSSNANFSNNSIASTKTPGGDMNEFLMKAAQGGMAEVELGKMASEKSQNADVKKFAQMMVQDHSNGNTELKSLAAKKNVTLPADVGADHKASADKLKTLSGAEFDKAYVQTMVDDHKKTIDMFEAQSTNATDADVKTFAAKTLPTLKKHLETIQEIQSKMK